MKKATFKGLFMKLGSGSDLAGKVDNVERGETCSSE